MRGRRLLWVVALVAGVTILAGVVQAPAGTARRKIFMSAVEYKGGTNVADEAYPPAEEPGTRQLTPLGGGYGLKPPDGTGRWEVESYRWEPGFLVVKKGQRVLLEIAGINGARHDAELIAPSGAKKGLVVTRGRLTRVRFHANETGIWHLVCNTHPPGMTAEILVIR